MAAEWREAFAALGAAGGFETRPLLAFPATGANGADLPARGTADGPRGGDGRAAAGLHAGRVPDRVLGHRRARRLLPPEGGLPRRLAARPGAAHGAERAGRRLRRGGAALPHPRRVPAGRRPHGGGLLDRRALRLRPALAQGRGGRRLPAALQAGRPHHQPPLGRDLHRPLRGREARRALAHRRGAAGGGGHGAGRALGAREPHPRGRRRGTGGGAAARVLRRRPGAGQHRGGRLRLQRPRGGDRQHARGREGRLPLGLRPLATTSAGRSASGPSSRRATSCTRTSSTPRAARSRSPRRSWSARPAGARSSATGRTWCSGWRRGVGGGGGGRGPTPARTPGGRRGRGPRRRYRPRRAARPGTACNLRPRRSSKSPEEGQWQRTTSPSSRR